MQKQENVKALWKKGKKRKVNKKHKKFITTLLAMKMIVTLIQSKKAKKTFISKAYLNMKTKIKLHLNLVSFASLKFLAKLKITSGYM